MRTSNHLVGSSARANVFGIGEVLWDLLPSGRKMGGAPANFAYHARVLGANSYVISQVGDDALGKELVERLTKLGVTTDGIAVDSLHHTGTVSVDLTPDGQPCYTIHEGVAWDYLKPEARLLSSVAKADALCFGTLAQRCPRSRRTVQQLVRYAPHKTLRIFDVNLRQSFYSRAVVHASLQLANIVKLNDAELPIVGQLLGIRGPWKKQIKSLFDSYDLRLVACTRGARGSVLFDGIDWGEVPGLPVKVVDTVGAGDAFTAALTMGMVAGWPVGKIGAVANEIAAYVCSCAGATPPLPARLVAHFKIRQPRIVANE